MKIFNQKIDKAKTICILGHINPDGDCLGSTLSIYNYILNKYNDKKVKVYLEKASEKFNILKGFDKISQDTNDAIEYDLCIVCDCASMERIKEFSPYLTTSKDQFIIDHHETNNLGYKDCVIVPDAPATCELVYDILEKEYIDKDVATCLYVGLASDTGVFRYCSTTSKTMKIAGELMDKGLDFTEILDRTIFLQSFNQKKLIARVIEKAEFLAKGKVLFSSITENELKELNLEKKDVDVVVPFLRETENIELAAFAYEVGHNIFKISLRSNGDDLNCATIAFSQGGGGHKRAAGFTLKEDIDKVKKDVEKLYLDSKR